MTASVEALGRTIRATTLFQHYYTPEQLETLDRRQRGPLLIPFPDVRRRGRRKGSERRGHETAARAAAALSAEGES